MDPRKEAHDPFTWALLEPRGAFDLDLERLANGCARKDLRTSTRQQIAVLKFPPVVGTTIEAKHHKVSLAENAHGIGRVRVSLSNRLPMLERWLSRKVFGIDELLDAFESARAMKHIPAILGFERHPDLGNLTSMSAMSARRTIAQILYRCDMEHMHRPLKPEAKAHAKMTNKRRAEAAKLVKPGAWKQRRVRDQDDLVASLMNEHFLETAQSSKMYTCPRRFLRLQAVTDVLDCPATLQATMSNAGVPGDLELDIDVDGVTEENDEDIYFNMTFADPGARHTVPVAVGAGSHLPTKKAAIAFFSGSAGFEADHIVNTKPLYTGSARDCIMLLNIGRRNFSFMKEACVKFESASTLWTLRDATAPAGSATMNLAKTIGGMMHAGANPGKHQSLPYLETPCNVDVLNYLHSEGAARPYKRKSLASILTHGLPLLWWLTFPMCDVA